MAPEFSYYLKLPPLRPESVRDQLRPDILVADSLGEQIRGTDLSLLPRDQEIRLEANRQLGHLLVRLQGIQDWIGDQVDNPGRPFCFR